tara:strand:+ start:2547 stop:3713 length:1167 start_codon:yes stop_codon:yes gene_type:complete
MSTLINTRSPFYKKITNASLAKTKLELYIWQGTYAERASTDKKYTLTKLEVGGNNYVTYELSKLIRDYMITEYGDYSTDSLWIDAVVTIYNSSGVIVQVGGSDTTTSAYLAIDGYGYFENGINPRSVEYTTPMLLQNNTTVYYSDGQDIRIPVYAEAATITATLTPTVTGTTVKWDEADIFWQAGSNTWNGGNSSLSVIDNGDSDQKIQYLIIIGTQDLVDNSLLTLVSTNSSYSTNTVITLTKVCEPKYTPLSIIFYNKYGALQNMWFFKKSMTDINIKSETFKNNMVDFNNNGGEPTYALTKHQEKKFNSNGKESITISSGFYDESFNEVVRQMLLSEQVWIYDGSSTLPINLKSNKLQFKKSVNDKLISYTISFDYAFDKINNII